MEGFKKSYKDSVSFLDRKEYSTKLLRKYPDRIPVIVELSPSSRSQLVLKRNKFLVPIDLTMQIFIANSRKFIKSKTGVSSETLALFFLCENKLIGAHENMGMVYEKCRQNDGLLYFVVTAENTFG